jgi:3-isopropylmalate/(R)-2-methylmalate dehydratase small subunit
MEPFSSFAALVVPLDRANVDTDAILPKQFMKSIRRSGFGDNLFDEWRYLDRGEPGQDVSKRRQNPDFPLNQPRYANARILLARENFGCGSSREHAVWALRDFGIRTVIAPSFAEIFRDNCLRNGVLPAVLAAEQVEGLFALVEKTLGLQIHIDLGQQVLTLSCGKPLAFEVDAADKRRLLNGLDDIALTLQRSDLICSYEVRRRALEPWLFG